jgi:hypothetical protein
MSVRSARFFALDEFDRDVQPATAQKIESDPSGSERSERVRDLSS